jgi:hypothetical protein
MRSVLFFSRYLPGERLFGSDTRMDRVLDWLTRHGLRIHFAQLLRRSPAGGTPRLIDSRLASLHRLSLAGCGRPGTHPLPWQQFTRPCRWNQLRSLISRRHRPSCLTTRLKALLDETQAEFVWIDHTDMAPLLASLPAERSVLKIVDTHDVLHQRDASLLAAGLPAEAGLDRRQEAEVLSQADVVLAIQEQDRQSLTRLLPGQRVLTVAHAITIDPQPCQTPDLCFVGSQYHVNEASLLSFLAEAWPAIRARSPRTRLQIAGGVGLGSRIARAAHRDPNIVIRGLVPATRDIYRGSAVVICPLVAGSGLKIKMVEALAHGKAVVASPIAAQGLETGGNRAFILADSPADFVEPVLRLLSDGAARSQWEQRALEYARQQFHPTRVWRELDALLPCREAHRVRRAA